MQTRATELPGKLKMQPGVAEMAETERRGKKQDIVLGGRSHTSFLNSPLCLRSLRASGLHLRRPVADMLLSLGVNFSSGFQKRGDSFITNESQNHVFTVPFDS